MVITLRRASISTVADFEQAQIPQKMPTKQEAHNKRERQLLLRNSETFPFAIMFNVVKVVDCCNITDCKHLIILNNSEKVAHINNRDTRNNMYIMLNYILREGWSGVSS